MAPSRMLVLQEEEWLPFWGEVFAHRQVDAQPTKWSKSNNDKSAVALLKKGDWHERGSVTDRSHDRSGQPDKRSDKKLERKSSRSQFSNARQLGCVFQDMTPPKSLLRKSTDMPKPIQRVKLKRAIARHTKIRDQNPSHGYNGPGEPHERSSNAPTFEDRSHEETEWQELGACDAAWKLAQNVFKFKEYERASFFSSPESRCHLASTLKPEEREFVVDSGASMHMISKKDLSKAEMDTLTKSCSPTIVITANGEVQTHEKWTALFFFFCGVNLELMLSPAYRKCEKWTALFFFFCGVNLELMLSPAYRKCEKWTALFFFCGVNLEQMLSPAYRKCEKWTALFFFFCGVNLELMLSPAYRKCEKWTALFFFFCGVNLELMLSPAYRKCEKWTALFFFFFAV